MIVFVVARRTDGVAQRLFIFVDAIGMNRSRDVDDRVQVAEEGALTIRWQTAFARRGEPRASLAHRVAQAGSHAVKVH